MKTEEAIRSELDKFGDGKWLFEASPYWREDSVIPIGVVLWFVRASISKYVLEDIPKDVFGFYCPFHQQAYLERAVSGTGCPKCPQNNIWEEQQQGEVTK